MWIAKPFQALSEVEIRQWVHACSWRRRKGEDVPLSQTLTWARAAQVSFDPYVVFNPAENVGGVVLGSLSEDGMRFECINGPLLDWDAPESAARQVATFAMAVSKLSGSFAGLMLRPRWEKGSSFERGLPIEADRRDYASTLLLEISSGFEEGFADRLKRTIRASEDSLASLSWKAIDRAEEVDAFTETNLPALKDFAQERGFYVPGEDWFRALLESSWISQAEGVRFYLSEARVGDARSSVEASLLVAIHGTEAHHLFGMERRGSDARGAWSAQALAIRNAMVESGRLGAGVYDFNGYIDPEDSQSSYAGVARFKAQFGGMVKDYEIPEFLIL